MRNVEAVQQMIDWMEENFENNPSLPALSQAVGYSPWYCSCMFHDIVGMTLKSYMTKGDYLVLQKKSGIPMREFLISPSNTASHHRKR